MGDLITAVTLDNCARALRLSDTPKALGEVIADVIDGTRGRLCELEGALRAIIECDPLQFIGRGDASDMGSAHLQHVIGIARAALQPKS